MSIDNLNNGARGSAARTIINQLVNSVNATLVVPATGGNGIQPIASLCSLPTIPASAVRYAVQAASACSSSFPWTASNGSGIKASYYRNDLFAGDGAVAYGRYNSASGQYSHASGYFATASGFASHANGWSVQATGQASHAEGTQNLASGETSHAEGNYVTASGVGSHAEGYNTKATNYGSHAEGNSTIASGQYAHAEGISTIAYSDYQHATGRLNLNNNTEDYFVIGDGDINTGIRSNAFGVNATRMYASNSIFFPDLTSTAQNNVLTYNSTTKQVFFTASSAIGGGGVAANPASPDMGIQFNNNGVFGANYNFRFDYNTFSLMQGFNPNAINQYSHAEGLLTTTKGKYSHAEGRLTTTYGEASHVEGNSNYTGHLGYNANSITGGIVTLSSSYGDIASIFITDDTLIVTDPYFGWFGPQVPSLYLISQSYFDGTNTIIELYDTTLTYVFIDPPYVGLTSNITPTSASVSLGSYSHAEGNGSKAVGYASHAEGVNTQALEWYSHAEGNSTIAKGQRSHAEGFNTIALGQGSHAEGGYTRAEGNGSHAEGDNTVAFGGGSHAEGGENHTVGLISHAEGYRTGATSSWSHTEGYNTHTGIARSIYYTGDIGQTTPGTIIISGDVAQDFLPAPTTILIYQIGSGFYVPYEVCNAYYDSNSNQTFLELCDSSVVIPGICSGIGCISIPGRPNNGNVNDLGASSQHAEGEYTYAIGLGSHTEGLNTQTLGRNAHAEGYFTSASGNWAHVEGMLSKAWGQGSHAEGRENATGQKAYACTFQNGIIELDSRYSDVTFEFNSPYVYVYTSRFSLSQTNITYGKNVIDPSPFIYPVTVGGITYDNAILIDLNSVNYDPNTNVTSFSTYTGQSITDTVFVVPFNSWALYPPTSADYTIGIEQHAEGKVNEAVGNSSHTEGLGTRAIGAFSHAEGNYVQSVGNFSHAEGYLTQTVGDYSHAEGLTNTIGNTAIGSHAEGTTNYVYGPIAHAEGIQNQILNTATASHAEGRQNFIHGDSAHVEGYGNTVVGDISHAEGWNTETGVFGFLGVAFNNGIATIDSTVGDVTQYFSNPNTYWSIPITDYYFTNTIGTITPRLLGTNFDGTNTFVTTSLNSTYGAISFYIGDTSISSDFRLFGNNVYLMGRGPNPVFVAQHTEGANNYAVGTFSHVEGFNNIAFGNSSHTEGSSSVTLGVASHAEGLGTIAYSNYQHATGRFNLDNNSDDYFVIGDGINAGNRSNAFGVNNVRMYASNSIYFPDLTQASHNNILIFNTASGQVFFTASSAIGGNIIINNYTSSVTQSISSSIVNINNYSSSITQNLYTSSIYNYGSSSVTNIYSSSIYNANPGGTNHDVQFNNNGVFGGEQYFRYFPESKSVSIGNSSNGSTSVPQGNNNLIVGYGNTIDADNAVAFGFQTEVHANGAVAFGGFQNKTYSANSFVGGYESYISGSSEGSMAFGYRNIISSSTYAFALGNQNRNLGPGNSLAGGALSVITGSNSGFVWGNSCLVSGDGGNNSVGIAMGLNTTASGNYGAFAVGRNVEAAGQSQTVVGKFNITGNTTDIFVVGNGTSTSARSDAFKINTTGYVVMPYVSASCNFANDAAAQAGGVPLGGIYHTNGTLKIRLV